MKEIDLRFKDKAKQEVIYLLMDKDISDESRELLEEVIVLGDILNKYCFLEASQHLFAAKNCLVRDLRRLSGENQ